jgi:prepilin-type N-terminal cleavage/methylation domain-containing protein
MKSKASEHGFTLIEVLIGLVIMGVIAIMAWRGMDTLLRSHAGVLERSVQQKIITDVVEQWMRDCESMISAEELASWQRGLLPFVQGAQQTWWLRSTQAANRWSWQLVGYTLREGQLQRWASGPLSDANDAISLWAGVYREPDLLPASVQQTLILPAINAQRWSVDYAGTAGASSPMSLQVEWRSAGWPHPLVRHCLAGVLR